MRFAFNRCAPEGTLDPLVRQHFGMVNRRQRFNYTRYIFSHFVHPNIFLDDCFVHIKGPIYLNLQRVKARLLRALNGSQPEDSSQKFAWFGRVVRGVVGGRVGN